ncbi:hypothetical protein O7626_03675 [Micromonospora sp. WMMD1102]|uniref:hypothetical protein n=1 Tax=Micromonospora sp. WMMD1102 TaxID=3016105 RepID=UPI0024156196|nr:hypothetical protein [Micromonospora sp. WMMD1102]MDG4785040.1 hypothetical protein [Micromonospora sp. WMMD1102]
MAYRTTARPDLTDPPAAPAVPVEVETILLSAVRDGLRFRVRSGPLVEGEHPDALARNLAGLSRRHPHALLHSTSWRFQGTGIVLTYVALPDPDLETGQWTPVHSGAIAGQDDPLTPASVTVRPVDVAVHACRHLAFLRHTDPLVAGLAADLPDLWRHIERFSPTVAGLLTPPTSRQHP